MLQDTARGRSSAKAPNLMSTEDIQQVHKLSMRNRQEVLGSYICGCFYCLADIHPEEITVWWYDDAQGVSRQPCAQSVESTV